MNNESQLKQIADEIKNVSDAVALIEQKAQQERKILESKIQENRKFTDEELMQKYAEIGKNLIEAKKIIKSEGKMFIEWVKTSCPFGTTSAQRYMMLFKFIDSGGAIPKMSLMSFIEMQTATTTQEQKEKIEQIIKDNGYVTLNEIRKIKNNRPTNPGKKTDINLASRRIRHVLQFVEHSKFGYQELLNIKDEISDAIEFINALLIKAKKEQNNA